MVGVAWAATVESNQPSEAVLSSASVFARLDPCTRLHRAMCPFLLAALCVYSVAVGCYTYLSFFCGLFPIVSQHMTA